MIFELFASTLALVGVDQACAEEMSRGGQQHGNSCSFAHMERVEDELNRAWKEALPKLKQRELLWQKHEDGPGPYTLLLQEQRAWIAYRETKCERVRFSYYRGSAAPWAYNSCMVDMAIDRIHIIRSEAEVVD